MNTPLENLLEKISSAYQKRDLPAFESSLKSLDLFLENCQSAPRLPVQAALENLLFQDFDLALGLSLFTSRTFKGAPLLKALLTSPLSEERRHGRELWRRLPPADLVKINALLQESLGVSNETLKKSLSRPRRNKPGRRG